MLKHFGLNRWPPFLNKIFTALLLSLPGAYAAGPAESIRPYWKIDSLREGPGLEIVNSTAVVDRRANCSGVFVSSEGHMLTALHCLRQGHISGAHPLFAYKNLPSRFPEDSKDPEPASGAVFASHEQRPNLKYEIWPPKLGKKIGQEAPETVQVLAVGKGFPAKFPLGSDNERAFDEFRKNNDDWALIKFKNLPKDYSCSKISSMISEENQQVWLTGFPSYPRPSFSDWVGKEDLNDDEVNCLNEQLKSDWLKQFRSAFDYKFPLYVSNGGIYRDNQSMLKANPNLGGLGISEQVTRSGIHWASTAPSYPGFSGGGAFDSAGRLIGINVMKVIMGRKYYETGPKVEEEPSYKLDGFTYGTTIMSLQYIQAELNRILGPEAAIKALNCNTKIQKR